MSANASIEKPGLIRQLLDGDERAGSGVECVVRVAQRVGQQHEAITVGFAAKHLEIVVHHVVHPRPLVPGETAAQPNASRGGWKVIGRPDDLVPARPKLDRIEPAVLAGQRPALKPQRLLQLLGVMRSQPVQLPVL